MRRFLIIVFILNLSIACTDLLELNPTDSITAENAVKNEKDLKNAIVGCYDALQSGAYYGRMLIVLNEIGSDNAYNGGTIIEYDQFNKNNVQEDNIYLEEIWAAPYEAINRCNTAIYYTNTLPELSEESRNEYLAELNFLRALNYFNLTRLFGDVPLKLEATFNEENLNTPLSSQQEIYTQILLDLNFANNKLSNTDVSFATDLAVKTLLAKVYLELKNYDLAINYCDTVLSGTKILLVNYEDLFLSEENSESIFEISFSELLTDKNRLAEYCFPTSLGGRYEIAPEPELISSFEPGDARNGLFIGNPPYCVKYENITSGDDNVYIFRLAEIYLIRAEARADLNINPELICDDINTIRNRAGLDSLNTNDYDELKIIIADERRHEFAFEGHRRFDLVRTDKASVVLGISKDKYFYPIPLAELNTNTEIN